jgi:gamma-glutamylcysteine synthetase
MSSIHPDHLTREILLDYFLEAAKPRKDWQVGMELERMGRDSNDGRAIPYDGEGPTVRKVLEMIR